MDMWWLPALIVSNLALLLNAAIIFKVGDIFHPSPLMKMSWRSHFFIHTLCCTHCHRLACSNNCNKFTDACKRFDCPTEHNIALWAPGRAQNHKLTDKITNIRALDGRNVGNSLLQFWELRFSHKA